MEIDNILIWRMFDTVTSVLTERCLRKELRMVEATKGAPINTLRGGGRAFNRHEVE